MNYMSGELIETESHKAYTEGEMVGFQKGEQSGFQKGERRKLISQIRGLENSDIPTAVKYLKVDEDYIRHILNLIAKHPEMDDEEIAELL